MKYSTSITLEKKKLYFRPIHLAASYDKVRERVKEVMGDKLLDCEAKRIRMESLAKHISQGRQETFTELMHNVI